MQLMASAGCPPSESLFNIGNKYAAVFPVPSLRAGQAGTKVLSVHQSLLGGRPDAHAFLAKAWHHQALLQIHEDLCSLHSCAICSLLRQMEKK